jgi:nicotinamidase/pyrazinamidase
VHHKRYAHIFASRDWHDAESDNGGHFATDAAPDFIETWPAHCVADTQGAEYHPELDTSRVNVHILKGQGRPAYSVFEGVTNAGRTLTEELDILAITEIDVVGIATDYCVLASAKDAINAGRSVRVLRDLVAGVAPGSSAEALAELAKAGAAIEHS